jgi:hypothetical protein
MTIDRNELAEEILLRENIRKAIKLVLRKKEEKKNERLLEENLFRKVIRKLIKEEASAPSDSTAINVLEELLKKIIPVLEEDFKSLTTNKEQRDSFRAHIVNGIASLLAPAEVNAEADDEASIDQLQELLSAINEISVEIGDEKPEEFIDIYGDEEEEEEEPPRTEEEEFGTDLEEYEYNLVGRNMAFKSFKKIRQNILDSFGVVSPDDEDRETFYDYLITNVKLYFDRFEKELAAMVNEPTTSVYDQQAAESEDDLDLNEYVDLDNLLEGIEA